MKLASSSRRAGLILLGVYLVLLSAGSRAAHGRAMSALENQLEGPIQSTSTHPQPAVPWRFRVVVQTPARLYRAMVDLRLGTVDGVTALPRGLDNPRLEKARDTDEYRVWEGFARHRFAGTFEGQLVLGDGRYSWSPEPSWSNLLVPVDNGPTGSK